MARTRAPGSRRKSERFSSVSPQRIPRSRFNMSYSHKTTINSGFLYPVYSEEVLPGDSITIRPSFFARMLTPLRPFMDGLHLETQWFFTPMRHLWENWHRFQGEREDPDDHNDYTIPQMTSPNPSGHTRLSLADYLGLPTNVYPLDHTCLYHRCYSNLYTHWYRDENLQDSARRIIDDGPDNQSQHPLRRRGKRKDYFSGALPFAQKGDPVDLPLTGSAQVHGIGGPTFNTTVGTPTAGPLQMVAGGDGNNPAPVEWNSSFHGSGTEDLEWANTNLWADLGSVSAVTINEMRTAIGLQRTLEIDARGGTRLNELILARFGVHTDDIRLMRPALLATTSQELQTQQVANTAGESTAFVGDLGAFTTGTSVGRGFSHNITEHGIIMGIASIRADLTYQQGLERRMSRESRYDFYEPSLAGLGEQAVISREIFADGTGDKALQTGDYSIWGYQPRYEEYRHRNSHTSGDMRSTSSVSLDYWHLGLDFEDTRPLLNDVFIEEDPPVSRIVAVPSQQEFILDCYFDVNIARPMPKFGTPGLTRF